ncbi:hypothetical protein D3C75_778740 [compost metagenome]
MKDVLSLTKCNNCGQCCRVIILNQSVKDMVQTGIKKPNKDLIFILKNWIPISKRNAMALNPFLRSQNVLKEHYKYYSCKRLSESGECLVEPSEICPRKKIIEGKMIAIYDASCPYKK